ncbi:MAG: hypothetical protein Fur0037_00570 [Planctomycetota bacterium]
MFAALLLAGILLLYLGLGGEDFAGTSGARTRESGERRQAPPTAESLRVEGRGQDIGVVLHGGMTIPRSREVKAGNRTEHVPVYELAFEDSEPLGEGIQRLDRVAMRIFDRGEPAADLTAATAYVELTRDRNGSPSLREDKEVDLRGAVLRSVPGARLGPLRLEMAQVRLRVREEEVELFTPTDREPVSLTVEGARGGSLAGLGLQARLPKESGGALRRIDVEILNEPRLVSGDLRVSASGRMHFVEETAGATALVTVQGDVVLTLPRGEGVSVEARGERLLCWLRRKGEGRGGSVDWRLLRLDGAPAIARGSGAELRAARISVVPGLFGAPFDLVASGGETVLEQQNGGGRTEFRARRIRLLRPSAHLGAIHASFGFPRVGLLQLDRLQIGICEGESRVESRNAGSPPLSMRSDRGIRLFRTDSSDPDAAVRLCGLGVVDIEQGRGEKALAGHGEDGFVLTRRAGRVAGQVFESLRLGPADPTSRSPYRLRSGEISVVGTGACELQRTSGRGGATTRAVLRSANEDIEARLGARLGDVLGASGVIVATAGAEPTALEVSGPRTLARIARSGGVLEARAPHMYLESLSAMRFESDAEQDAIVSHRIVGGEGQRLADVRLSGPVLRLFRAGFGPMSLTGESRGDRRVHAEGDGDAGGRGPFTFALDADEIRIVPFAVAPSAVRSHVALPLATGLAVGGALRRPWMFATGSVDLSSRSEREGVLRARGRSLAFSFGSRSALLFGDEAAAAPAVVEHRDAEGRRVAVRGPWLRVWRDGGDRVTAFASFRETGRPLPPEVELHDAGGPSSALAHLWATCEGAIEIRPESVSFGGPVRANTILPGGSADPEGLAVRGQHVDMLREASGRVFRVTAGEGVDLRWGGLRARARSVSLDTRWKRCTASDPVAAEMWLPNGVHVRARQAEANYETLAVSLWQYALAAGGAADGRGRR